MASIAIADPSPVGVVGGSASKPTNPNILCTLSSPSTNVSHTTDNFTIQASMTRNSVTGVTASVSSSEGATGSANVGVTQLEISHSLSPAAETLVSASAGAVASVMSMALCYPLDVIRTALQLDTTSSKSKPARLGSTDWGSNDPNAKSNINANDNNAVTTSSKVSSLIQTRGWRGLYQGIVPVLQTIAISQFLYFYIFEGLKKANIAEKVMRLIRMVVGMKASGSSSSGTSGSSTSSGTSSGSSTSSTSSSSSGFDSFVGSLLAGVINMILTEPLWKANVHCQRMKTGKKRVKDASNTNSNRVGQKLETGGSQRNDQRNASESDAESRDSSQNVIRVAYHLMEKEGPFAMWNGLGTSLILVGNPVRRRCNVERTSGTSASLILNVGNRIREKLSRVGDISAVRGFLIGAFTKAVATVFTYPLQVAQSRLRSDTSPNPSLIKCFLAIYQNESLEGYFKGMGPKLIQTVLNAAFMFAFYEQLVKSARRIAGRIL